jgi:hypothetical protein
VRSGPLSLEAAWLNADGGRDPVVALHPHPQHGGTMDNPVIGRAAHLLALRGHPVLQLNFRGVGASGGGWSGGAGEVDDAVAAADAARLRAARPGVVLCGYSFGAWVSLEAAARLADVRRLILISPPNLMFDFSALAGRADVAAVTGDRDEFCDLPALRALAGDRLTVIPGADHFYSRALDGLGRWVEALAT